MKKIEFDENEIIDALQRSGYLFESEIAQYLYKTGFFVESNQVILDPITGKNRELDLIAEYYDWNKPLSNDKCCAKIKFVFELKNNTAPIVLMTEYQSSPNIEDWLGLKEYITIPEGLRYDSTAYYDALIESRQKSIFTQYCSFQMKKGEKKGDEELMAVHPEVIYSGLAKITQYCEERTIEREIFEEANGYLRHFIYLPILLISDDLFELKLSNDNKPNLTKVDSSILIYNYHDNNNDPTMAFVFVVTKKGFPDFINAMLKLENDIEENMKKIRQAKR